MSSVPDDETSSLLNPRGKKTGKFEKLSAKTHFFLCESFGQLFLVLSNLI